MTKGLNITLTDEDVLPIDVLIFKGIRIGAFHDANTNITTISSIYDGTTEQQINDNFATWKQEYLNYQPTATVIKNRKAGNDFFKGSFIFKCIRIEPTNNLKTWV